MIDRELNTYVFLIAPTYISLMFINDRLLDIYSIFLGSKPKWAFLWLILVLSIFIIILIIFKYCDSLHILLSWSGKNIFMISDGVISSIFAYTIFIMYRLPIINFFDFILILQLVFLIVLDLLPIYFIGYPSKFYLMLPDFFKLIKKFVKFVCHSVILELLCSSIVAISPVLIIILLQQVLKYNFFGPNCYSFVCLPNSIPIHLCVFLILFFMAMIADLAIRGLLSICGLNYKPKGISNIILDIVYSIFSPIIRRIVDPLINILTVVYNYLLTILPHLSLPVIQFTGINLVYESTLSEEIKNLLIVILLIILPMIYYFKNGNVLDVVAILFGIFGSLIGVAILFIMFAILSTINSFGSVLDPLISNNPFIGLIIILFAAIMLFILFFILNVYMTNIIINTNCDKLLAMSIFPVIDQFGGRFINDKYRVRMESCINRKNNILLAVDRPSPLLRQVLRFLARLIGAIYVPVERADDLSERYFADFKYEQDINYNIMAYFPEGVEYVTDSAKPTPELVDKSTLKWTATSLDSLKKIQFDLLVPQEDGSIHRKPKVRIECNYIAQSDRGFSFKQKIARMK